MWSFLLGAAAGYFVLNNGPLLRRALASTIVKTERGLGAAGKEAKRTGARIVEDVQDILAEAAAEREADRLRNIARPVSSDHNLNVN